MTLMSTAWPDLESFPMAEVDATLPSAESNEEPYIRKNERDLTRREQKRASGRTSAGKSVGKQADKNLAPRSQKKLQPFPMSKRMLQSISGSADQDIGIDANAGPQWNELYVPVSWYLAKDNDLLNTVNQESDTSLMERTKVSLLSF